MIWKLIQILFVFGFMRKPNGTTRNIDTEFIPEGCSNSLLSNWMAINDSNWKFFCSSSPSASAFITFILLGRYASARVKFSLFLSIAASTSVLVNKRILCLLTLGTWIYSGKCLKWIEELEYWFNENEIPVLFKDGPWRLP